MEGCKTIRYTERADIGLLSSPHTHNLPRRPPYYHLSFPNLCVLIFMFVRELVADNNWNDPALDIAASSESCF